MDRDNIKRLMEEIRELEQSDKNRIKKENWAELPLTARDQWRGVPRMDGSWKDGVVPIAVDMQNSFWAQKFGFSLKDYYLDPLTFIEYFLRITLDRFRIFDDDIFITRRIPIWMGCGYEGSMFGMKVHYFDDKDPWLDHRIIINEPVDLERMEAPDFNKSGLMPEAIKMFEVVRNIVDDDFEVFFPEWIRSPFGVAVYVRGFENFLIDMVINDDFAVRLLKYITDCRKKWYDNLASYLNEPVKKGNLFNDEVNCPTLSPELYRNYILPFEKDLCSYHGGLLYWHSCGNVSDMLIDIASIPQIDMLHVGPWTSIEKAAQIFGLRAPLEICLNPQKDIIEASEEDMQAKVFNIMDKCFRFDIKGFTLRCSGLSVLESTEFTENKARSWNSSARRAVEKFVKSQ